MLVLTVVLLCFGCGCFCSGEYSFAAADKFNKGILLYAQPCRWTGVSSRLTPLDCSLQCLFPDFFRFTTLMCDVLIFLSL